MHGKDMQIAFEQQFFGIFFMMPKAFLMMIFPVEIIVCWKVLMG
jgi:hypothetical protein